jgi:cytochrome c
MKSIALVLFATMMIMACSNNRPASSGAEDEASETELPKSIAEGKGIGQTTEVQLNNPLDQEMIKRGKAISEMKCAACHRFSDQRVVGPGWAGVTTRRKPEWIMNMITDVEAMLDEDPAAREMLEECLTRMPNQNLTVADARDVLEFMYDNDEAQAAK